MAPVIPLRVIVESRTYVFSQHEVSIGRMADADVVVDDGDVSRVHGIVTRMAGEWSYVDNSSRNGSFYRGERVNRLILDRAISMNLAGVAGPIVTLEPAVDLVTGLAADPGESPSRVSIGRAVDNDVVVDETDVSRYHAELLATADGVLEIIDLDSRNGTRVNGSVVSRATLREFDVVTVGGKDFKVTRGALEPVDPGQQRPG